MSKKHKHKSFIQQVKHEAHRTYIEGKLQATQATSLPLSQIFKNFSDSVAQVLMGSQKRKTQNKK